MRDVDVHGHEPLEQRRLFGSKMKSVGISERAPPRSAVAAAHREEPLDHDPLGHRALELVVDEVDGVDLPADERREDGLADELRRLEVELVPDARELVAWGRCGGSCSRGPCGRS